MVWRSSPTRSSCGNLDELVIQADQASVARKLDGDPGKALAAPRQALQKKLLDGLRYLLKTEFKLNQPGPSDGWLTQDVLWLVSKTVSDKLRAYLLSLGIEGIPSNNTALFNVLQDHGMALPTPDGKAIWKASVTSDTGWSHSFTLLRLSPALIWEAAERPEAFAGTVTVIQDDGSEEPADPQIPTTSLSVESPRPVPSAGDGVDALVDLLGVPDMPASDMPEPSDDVLPTVAENHAVEPSAWLFA
jgi:hypothetical protein